MGDGVQNDDVPSDLSEAVPTDLSEAVAMRNGRTPAETGVARAVKAPGAAAGLGAVASTIRFGIREMGPRRTLSMYLKVNQKDGFDCQSCAWPNPDDTRHVAEFCENGAKAISSEATRRRVTREFFEQHSIDDLAGRSDQWLNDQGRLTEPVVLRPGSRPLPADRLGRGIPARRR